MDDRKREDEQLIELAGKIGAILATPDDLSPEERAERLKALQLPSQADLEDLQRTYEQRWEQAQADLESRLAALRTKTDAVLKDIDEQEDTPPPSPAYETGSDEKPDASDASGR